MKISWKEKQIHFLKGFQKHVFWKADTLLALVSVSCFVSKQPVLEAKNRSSAMLESRMNSLYGRCLYLRAGCSTWLRRAVSFVCVQLTKNIAL